MHFNLDTEWKWAVRFTLRLLYTLEEAPSGQRDAAGRAHTNAEVRTLAVQYAASSCNGSAVSDRCQSSNSYLFILTLVISVFERIVGNYLTSDNAVAAVTQVPHTLTLEFERSALFDRVRSCVSCDPHNKQKYSVDLPIWSVYCGSRTE